MTPKQREFLQALADGDPNPVVMTKHGLRATRVGFACRIRGWASFVWVGPDGSKGTYDDLKAKFPTDQIKFGEGQFITDAGREALSRK